MEFDVLDKGSKLGNYEIISGLHKGAMAHLYLAQDLYGEGEKVVLKIPFSDIINNPCYYYHFQNEKRIGLSLKHPQIINFLQQKSNKPYIVLEYIEGHDLRSSFQKEKDIALDNACNIMFQLLEGVKYLHDMNIIHLDLKPENILISSTKEIKIIDFGTANKIGVPDFFSEDLPTPQGSPYYMAPEQLDGCRTEKRSDIFSLAVIFYEILTGHLPFGRSKNLYKVGRMLKRDPVPPRYYNLNIPAQVQDIILSCLSWNPDNRYPSITTLKDDLARYNELPVTFSGMQVTKKQYFSSVIRSFFRCYNDSCPLEFFSNSIAANHILVAITNDDNSEIFMETLKKYAAIEDTQITILHVLDYEIDYQFSKYSVVEDGKKLMLKLENIVALLSKYKIDPMVRLVAGDIAETIVKIAKNTKSTTILLGSSRQTNKHLFYDKIIEKVSVKSQCHVVVI